jgi:tRNA (guanine9-N1)-methyltransferase
MEDIRTESNAQAGPSTTSSVLAATSQDANPDEPPKLSKNAIKKAAKRARAESEKLVRRAAEKERRKANAAKRKADMQAGLLSHEEVDEIRKRQEAKRLRNKVRAKGGNVVKDDEQTFKGGIVIDCGFDELMSEQVSVKWISIYSLANVACRKSCP